MGEPYHIESWRTRQGKERWWVKDSAGRLVDATAGGLNRQRVSDLCAALNEAFRAGVRTAQASRPRITVDDHTPPSESGICP